MKPSPGASPVKKTTHTKADTRKERSVAAHEALVAVSTKDFQKSYLNLPDRKTRTLVTQTVSNLVANVTGAETAEVGYSAIPALLNKIIEILAAKESYESKLVFKSSPTQHPHHHPCGHLDVPDFYAMPLKLYEKLRRMKVKPSWHQLDSVGEWKSGMTLTANEQSQAAAYAGSHNQSRPDHPGVLVFSACRGCYTIGYSDPSIWTTTEPVEWDNLVPLIGYIHSLHKPRSQVRDPTIMLSNRGLSDPPHWTIRDEALDIDGEFKIIHVGRAHSRMTTVFEHIDANGGPLIIKDSFLNELRGPERALFETLMEDGVPPGWVKIRLPRGGVAEPLFTPKVKFGGKTIVQRRKDRTVMENTGAAFNDCGTLSEAVAAVYDILEADRWAITKRRILHRDISPGNILIRPVKDSQPCEGVCFINGVFTGNREQPSSALLLDLDNGTCLPKSPLSPSLHEVVTGKQTRDRKNLRALSGTPMYIARAPSIGFYEGLASQFPKLPMLDEPIRQLYIKAYPGDPFRINFLVSLLKKNWQNVKSLHVKMTMGKPSESTRLHSDGE